MAVLMPLEIPAKNPTARNRLKSLSDRKEFLAFPILSDKNWLIFGFKNKSNSCL
jgi:hypothetical protein